jgi:hypothetical protein
MIDFFKKSWRKVKVRSKRFILNKIDSVFKDKEKVSFIQGLVAGGVVFYNGIDSHSVTIGELLVVTLILFVFEWYKSTFCVMIVEVEFDSDELLTPIEMEDIIEDELGGDKDDE